MIPRYDKKEISSLWTDEAKFQAFLKVELAIMEALEEIPIETSKDTSTQSNRKSAIPKGTAKQIEKKVKINPQRVIEIEEKVKHDVIAFCTSITEQLPPDLGRYFHYGVTSSDIIDTALSLQLKNSLQVILEAFPLLLKELARLAEDFKNVPTIGRSHGMYGEPLSFGQKFLGYYAEFSRRYQELKSFKEQELTAQFSGAVGNYTIVTPKAEAYAANLLELKVEAVSTQVIPRDRIAKLIQLNALTASAIERLAVEIRHLHRSEVDEIHEGFTPGQKGSSIMPHKKNPIASENLTGMARMLRSHCSIALENIVLWHERDISHSSAERFYLPDHFGILFYSLTRLTGTLKNLDIKVHNIKSRVESSFTYWSSYYLHILLSENGIRREELYEVVQKASFLGQQNNSATLFYETLKAELLAKGITTELPPPSSQAIQDVYLKHVNHVFDRTFKQYPLSL